MAAAEALDPMVVARDLFPDLPIGFPFEGFELEELILPDGDDMGIRSDDDEIKEEDLHTESGFGSVVVVTGLPIVPEEKFDTLLSKVVKGLTKRLCNADPRDNGVFMPLDDATKMTKGYAFVEFPRKEDAETLMKSEMGKPEGFRLDKSHVLHVYRFDDFEKYGKVPDQYVPYEPAPYKEPENMFSWLGDRYGRDQYLLHSQAQTSICWNDGKRSRAEPVYERANWSDTFVQWSPQGTMMATMHRQGVALWGGPSFARITRVAHTHAALIDFSPNERFLVTYSAREPIGPRDSFQAIVNVWDVLTGRLLRDFEGPPEDFSLATTQGALQWPVFKWAGGPDDAYFAKITRGKISIFQTKDMLLLGGNSVKADAVREVEWSPTEPILAAYYAEAGNQPAKITLTRIPELQELRSKGMQLDVSDVKMSWHPQGWYLAAKVESWTKTKKSTTTMFHVFSIKDKDIPLETIELPNKNDKVIAFAWEPKGHKIAILHGGDSGRPTVTVYSMRDEKSGKLAVKLVGQSRDLKNTVTNIYWSPQGKYIVYATLKGPNGFLEFVDGDTLDTLQTQEHNFCTDVAWDPTGRYVASIVTQVAQMDTGIKFWSFAGRELYSLQRDKMSQFAWRPRMPSLLTEEREKEIQKNLKQYTKRYDEEDEQLLMQADADVLAERQKYLDEWTAFVERKRATAKLLSEYKEQLYGARFAEKEYTLQKVLVEQVLDVREEPYQTK